MNKWLICAATDAEFAKNDEPFTATATETSMIRGLYSIMTAMKYERFENTQYLYTKGYLIYISKVGVPITSFFFSNGTHQWRSVTGRCRNPHEN